MNVIFVISSPTGVGKSTVCDVIQKRYADKIKRVITHTTRIPRKNEHNAEDYYFVNEQDFQKGIKNGDFVEWAMIHNNYYGTSKKALDDVLNAGFDVILAIDVQGAMNIIKLFDNAVSIFMLPPSFDEWMKRINKDNVRYDVKNRLRTAIDEFGYVNYFDYCIINDDLNSAVKLLENIMLSEHCKVKFSEDKNNDLVLKLKEETKKYLEV